MLPLALLADLHLSDVPETSQWACCQWAFELLSRRKPAAIIVAGDVTACGQARAARRFRRMLEAAGAPFIAVPGNSDRRNPAALTEVTRALTTAKRLDLPGLLILALDAQDGSADAGDLARCRKALADRARRKLVVFSHYPLNLNALPPWLAKSGALFLSAHRHRDATARGNGYVSFTGRGLDPDKAIGGPPCVAFFRFARGTWWRNDENFPGGSPAIFTAEEKTEFRERLGLCCLAETMETMRFAVSRRVPGVELRAPGAIEIPGIAGAISAWRARGGQFLSVHMPALECGPGAAAARQALEWRRLLRRGLSLGLDHLTVHVPGQSVRTMPAGKHAWTRVVRAYAASLAPALESGVPVGIENLHMRAGEVSDAGRGFGYLPGECLEFLQALRAACGTGKIGITLDIGHARNNGPFARSTGLSDWYALTGQHAQSYHLHQVGRTGDHLSNHQGFDGLYGPLISLSGFLWAWKTGQLRHAPLFIEVRNLAARLSTLALLRKALD